MLSWISNLLKRIWRALFAKKLDLSGTSDFPILDLDAIERDLNIREEGTENGRRDNPPPDSRDLDHVEGRIVQYFEDVNSEAFRVYRERAQFLDTQIKSWIATANQHAAALSAAAQNAKTDFEAQKILLSNLISSLHQRLAEQKQHFNNFKQKHQIDHPAQYPESNTFRIGILALLVLGETILNGFFFAKGSAFGLLGGAFTALILSVVNITIGFMAGVFIYPYTHHRSSARRFLAVLGIGFYALLAVYVCLSIAHFRDAYTAMDENPGIATLRTLLASPLTLREYESWLLFGIGILLSFIAFYEGVGSDDPYPGYGREDRIFRRLENDMYFEQERVFTILADLKQSKLDEFQYTAGELGNYGNWANNAINTRDQWTARFTDYMDQLERSCNELLRRYRSYNVNARSTAKPVYFDQQHRLHRYPVEPHVHTPPPLLNARAVQSAMGSIVQAYEDAVSYLRSHMPANKPQTTETQH